MIRDASGNELSADRAVKVQIAYSALMELTDDERGLVLCWFCRGCGRYVGPGEHCHCMRDE